MYSIWVPFKLSPNEKFDFDEPIGLKVCGYPSQLRRKLGYTGLNIEGLSSKEVGLALLPRVTAAILYTVAHSGPSMRLDWEPVSVFYKEGEPYVYWEVGFDPGRQLFPFDASQCVVYRSDKRFSSTMLTVGHSGISPSGRFLETLQKGLAEPGLKDGIVDQKLKDAANLYLLSQFEASRNSEFLTLCTILEILAPRPNRPEPVRTLIAKWMQYVRERAEAADVDPEVARSLRSLNGGLRDLKSESIGDSLSAYVRQVLSRDGKFKSNADEAARMVKRLYGKRSKVIHDGEDVSFDDLSALSMIVRKTLIATLRFCPM